MTDSRQRAETGAPATVEQPAAAGPWRPLAAWAALVFAVVAALAAGGFWFLESRPTGHGIEIIIPTPAPVTVQAAGEVLQPGVYELPRGSRVQDLLDAAGGATAGAELGALNLARTLRDGERLDVPRSGSAGIVSPMDGTQPSFQSGSATTDLIDLNTATRAELESLPSIGPARSQLIMDFRLQHGMIHRVDDLLQISGIGPATVESIRPLVVQP